MSSSKFSNQFWRDQKAYIILLSNCRLTCHFSLLLAGSYLLVLQLVVIYPTFLEIFGLLNLLLNDQI